MLMLKIVELKCPKGPDSVVACFMPRSLKGPILEGGHPGYTGLMVTPVMLSWCFNLIYEHQWAPWALWALGHS